jgi:hypothetical protein
MAKDKFKVGDHIETLVVHTSDGTWYSVIRGPGPNDVRTLGPFATRDEADEDGQQTARVLLGEQGDIKQSGRGVRAYEPQ